MKAAGMNQTENEPMIGTQKIADSVWLMIIARISMALAMPVLMLVVYLGSDWLDGQFEQQATASKNAIEMQVTRIDRIEKTATTAIDQSGKVNERLTVVETKQATDAATAATFQKDTLTRLDRLQDSIVSMSNAIAALTATMQAREDYERRQEPRR